MAGLIGRQEAREKLDALYRGLRDRLIPADESQPIVDGSFAEWEDLANEFDREITGGLLEIMAQVSASAKVTQPGNCPHCQSGNVKWLDPGGQRERQSEHSPVVTPRQVARCRSCGRSFSPSGPSVGLG